MNTTMTEKDIERLKATHAMDLTLLSTLLQNSQMQLATKARALKRAEAVLQDYLTALYPGLYAQALGARMSTVEAGEYFYQHYLYGDDPAELFGPNEVRQKAEVERARSAPKSEPVAQGVELSADAVRLLDVLGSHVLSSEVREHWAQRTGKAVGTAQNTVIPELLDKGLLRVQQIPVPRYLTRYASDMCYLLSPTGQAEYRHRFSSEPITYEAAYAPYKSPEAWWMIRATKALILAGNEHPANQRFTYSVYDPIADRKALSAVDLAPRYGNSEPDLIVVVTSRSGGKSVRLAVECKRGKYNSARLKQKLIKNLQDYATAGFSGCYYVANNEDTARVIGGTMTRLRDDLKERPDSVSTPGFLALFTLEALRDAWLPTPRFIATEFFDRKLQRVNPEWPEEAARPERYLRHTPGGKGQSVD